MASMAAASTDEGIAEGIVEGIAGGTAGSTAEDIVGGMAETGAGFEVDLESLVEDMEMVIPRWVHC